MVVDDEGFVDHLLRRRDTVLRFLERIGPGKRKLFLLFLCLIRCRLDRVLLRENIVVRHFDWALVRSLAEGVVTDAIYLMTVDSFDVRFKGNTLILVALDRADLGEARIIRFHSGLRIIL